MLVGFISG